MRVQRYIVDFDDKRKVSPFSFVLRNPITYARYSEHPMALKKAREKLDNGTVEEKKEAQEAFFTQNGEPKKRPRFVVDNGDHGPKVRSPRRAARTKIRIYGQRMLRIRSKATNGGVRIASWQKESV